MQTQEYKVGALIGGEYKVLEVLGGKGRSGMGVVYLVDNREIPRPIILKTPQAGTEELTKRRFVSEIQAWIKAGAHPNIVQAFWVREIESQIFVAAEYIEPDTEGRNTLTDFLNVGELPTETILMWATQFCYGMKYARLKGVVVHRDIKPDNLMVARNMTLKITDFGLAKLMKSDRGSGDATARPFARKNSIVSTSVTDAGVAMGTLPYMAPEQFLDARSVDHRADIYSFGIVLYQMASGNHYPYSITRDIASEYYRAHTSQSAVNIRSPLMPIINRCLQKDPDARYQTYEGFLKDLEGLGKSLGIEVPKAEQVNREDEELYAQAQSYVALGDDDRALKTIDEYISKYSENACGWTEKGRIHFERGEYEKGLVATRRSLKLNPFNTHAWNNLGILLNRTRAGIAEIREAFSKALYYDPCNTAAMMNLIGPLVSIGDYSEASCLVARALQLRPEKPLVLQKAEGLLKELFEQNNFNAAEALLVAWTEARPTDKDAWHNLGLIYLRKANVDHAIECFMRVRELSPDDNFAVLQLAKLNFEKKRGRECIKYCNELLNRGYEPLVAVSLKARVLNFVAGYDQAITFLRPYLRHNPDNDALWVVLSEIHEYRGNIDSAIEALQAAKRILETSKGDNVKENLCFVDEKLTRLHSKKRET